MWSSKGVTLCRDGWSDAQKRLIINFMAFKESGPMFLSFVNAEDSQKKRFYNADKLTKKVREIDTKI